MLEAETFEIGDAALEEDVVGVEGLRVEGVHGRGVEADEFHPGGHESASEVGREGREPLGETIGVRDAPGLEQQTRGGGEVDSGEVLGANQRLRGHLYDPAKAQVGLERHRLDAHSVGLGVEGRVGVGAEVWCGGQGRQIDRAALGDRPGQPGRKRGVAGPDRERRNNQGRQVVQHARRVARERPGRPIPPGE